MDYVVFDTPGEIDLRAFTLMGVSAKPNSANPIGYFGTGLKYAVATLVRLGAEVVVWVGQEKYTFFKRPDTFRGAEFEKLSMRRESFKLTRSRVTDLPYSLSYGRDWQPWMAFRELESNTRDEGGDTKLIRSEDGTTRSANDLYGGDENRTLIWIGHPAMVDAYDKRDEVFLPGGHAQGVGIQVIDGPSTHLYWRGMKVLTLGKPALFTYNFLDHMDLTEDRTLQLGDYYARAKLARWLLTSNSAHLIYKILSAPETAWEYGLNYPSDVPASAAFHRHMLSNPKRVHPNAWSYYSRYDSRIVEKNYDLFDAHPLPWKEEGRAVVDAKGRTVFDCPYGYEGKWELAAGAILKRINTEAPDEQEDRDEPLGDDVAVEEANGEALG